MLAGKVGYRNVPQLILELFFPPHYSGIPNNPLILLSSASHVSNILPYTRILVFYECLPRKPNAFITFPIRHRVKLSRWPSFTAVGFCCLVQSCNEAVASLCFENSSQKCSCGCSPNRLKLPRTVNNCFSCFVDALTASDVLKKSETTCAFESISQKVNCIADLGL